MSVDSVKTVLLTLGRLPVGLDMARSFHRAGWRVVVAEPFGMHLLRMSTDVARCHTVTAPADDPDRYLDELERIVRDEAVDFVVPVSEESMHVLALKARLDAVPVFGPSQQDALELHDKLEFARLARKFGLAAPASGRADSDMARNIASECDYVVKPRWSCSGRGIEFHERGAEPAGGAHELVQRRVDGDEFSSFSIVRDGKALVTVVYRAVVKSGAVAVCFERVDVPIVEKWVDVFAGRWGKTGFLAFDFIVNEDGDPFAIECNPRATSGIHFLDNESIAPALLGERESIGMRTETLLAEKYSCYSAALGSLFKPAERGHNFRNLFRSTDITWSRRDPWPFLLMTVNTWKIIWRAMRSGRTFAEVAALDIEWQGGDVA